MDSIGHHLLDDRERVGVVADRKFVLVARRVALAALLARWRAFLEPTRTRRPWGRPINLHAGEEHGPSSRTCLAPPDLDRRLQNNRALLAVAGRHLTHLSTSFSREAHVVILADHEGWILELRGTPRLLGGGSTGFALGCDWSEKTSVGSNAIGTTLATGDATVVCRIPDDTVAAQAMACLGAPIRRGGAIVGVLGIAALHPTADPVRMSRLCACAVAIEAGLEASRAASREAPTIRTREDSGEADLA